MYENLLKLIQQAETADRIGKIENVVGMSMEASGGRSGIGDIVMIYNEAENCQVPAEVVGFKNGKIQLMTYENISGITAGSFVRNTGCRLQIPVGDFLKGRIINALGHPIDEKGEFPPGKLYTVDSAYINPLNRPPIREHLEFGIKAIDGLNTIGKGQRMGIFAGSGVGKSTLMGMIARNVKTDINVIALVGERGREVLEFVKKDLGEEGMKRSVLIVATSDQPAMLRMKCPLVATTIAEYFRDQGANVLLMMDSVTRFGRAQREIGLAAGEPPTRRGFPPSVFSELPKLMERAGNSDKGSITALYTVLVEGDDMTEPIADETRSILDGHIVLSRKLAAANHYPAIDVQASVSRVMNAVVDKEHKAAAQALRKILAKYAEVELLVQIGEYKKGADAEADFALGHIQAVNAFLRQGLEEKSSFEETLAALKKVVL